MGKRKINSIAVSGQCSSGKSTLCICLSERLNWKHVDIGSDIKKMAKEYNLRVENFGSIPEKQLKMIDEHIRGRMNEVHNIIWDSRLSCYLARNNVQIFKIFCNATDEIRAERTAKRDGISINLALENVIKRDEEEMNVFKKLYGISDISNKEWIDLVVDTSDKNPTELTDLVIEKMNLLN